MTTKNPFLKAYTQQKSNAKRRGVEFVITYEEWEQVWLDSGKWELRGKGIGKYCMCRYNDEGPYAIGNVFIDLSSSNVREGNIGKVVSEETRQLIASGIKGKPHPWSRGDKNPMHRPEVKAKMSAAIGGANHYKARGVFTPYGYFPTAKEASLALNIPRPTVHWRAHRNKMGFSYGTKEA